MFVLYINGFVSIKDYSKEIPYCYDKLLFWADVILHHGAIEYLFLTSSSKSSNDFTDFLKLWKKRTCNSLPKRACGCKHVVGKPVMYNQMNPMSSLSLFAPRQVAVQQPLPQSSRRWVSLLRRRKWPDCPVQNATCEQAFIHSDTWAPASHLVTQLCVCVTNPYLTSYYCKCGPSH